MGYSGPGKLTKDFNDFIVVEEVKGIKDIIPSYHTLTLIYDIELMNTPLDFANDLIEKYSIGNCIHYTQFFTNPKNTFFS